jgi:hypothetical protein
MDGVIVSEESKKLWLALPQFLLEFEIKIHPIPLELMKKFTAKDGVIFPYDNKYVQRYLYMMRDMYRSVYGIYCHLPKPLSIVNSSWNHTDILLSVNDHDINEESDSIISDLSDDDWAAEHNIILTDYKSCNSFIKECTKFVKYFISNEKTEEWYNELRFQFACNFRINIDKRDELLHMFQEQRSIVRLFRSLKKNPIHSSTLQNLCFPNKDLYRNFFEKLNRETTDTQKTEDVLDTNVLPHFPLSKIKNKDGKTRYDSGSYPKKSCFICRGWVRKYCLTSYQCKTCAMPICNPDTIGVRDDKIGTLIRTKTCMEEHLSAVHPFIKCNGDYHENLQFPVHYKRWTAKNNKKYIQNGSTELKI